MMFARLSVTPALVVLMGIAISVAGCKKSKDGSDEDADLDTALDGEDDSTEPDVVQDGEDVPLDVVQDGEDVPLDLPQDVVEEETVDPCPSPGLTVGTAVEVAAPGAVIDGGALARAGGARMALAWSDGREVDVVVNEEVFLHLLDRDGTLVGSEVQVSDAALISRIPTLVWAGDVFAMLWGDGRALPAGNVFLRTADVDGTLGDSEIQVTTDGVGASYVSAAWTGTDLGVAWTDNREGTMDVYFARVGLDGAIEGSVVPVIQAAGNSYRPRVLWTGDSFLMVWDDTVGGESWEPHIYLAVLDTTGAVTTEASSISGTEGTANRATAAWSGSLLGVCWEDFGGGLREIYCATFDASGSEQTAPTRITTTDGASTFASLIHSPDGFALAWAMEDGTANDDEIRFALLSDTLEVTGGDTDLTDTAGELTSVSLAWTGAGYAVAFVEKDATGTEEDAMIYLPFTYCP